MSELLSYNLFGAAVILFVAWLISLACERGGMFVECRRWWKTESRLSRCILLLIISYCTMCTGKGPNPLAPLFRVLFWHGEDWALLSSYNDVEGAKANNAATIQDVNTATNNAREAVAFVETNKVVTMSFDWHQPNRLPYHDMQNIMGFTTKVVATNIAGVLYEDHYVSFNEAASTNPAVIFIEYAATCEDGSVERYTAEVVTNSYPVMVPVTLQSGTYNCYWFRCPVPVAFTNSVRDWNGEALFGSPIGVGSGFDLLGIVVVDDGDNLWVGVSTNAVIGGATNHFENGINITQEAQ